MAQESTGSSEQDYEWGTEQENFLKKWADKGLCFKMMHERSYRSYWCLNAWFNIPVIIIATITGTGNFASGSFGSSAFLFALGALNIFAGILATVATYTGVAQKLEAHRFAMINWDKFSRKIQIELAKSRNDRKKAKDFIRQMSEEYDRHIELSPVLPNDVIRWFSRFVDTGEFNENLGACGTCCFETVCFPCGCQYCRSLSCDCRSREPLASEVQLRESWADLELPDVIGRIRPTEIADVHDAPPVVSLQPVMVNDYSIYNLDGSSAV